MNKSFFYKDFKYWLKENRCRFKTCTPYISKVSQKSFCVMFQECGGLLYLLVDKHGEFSVWSHYTGKDILKKFTVLYGEEEIDKYDKGNYRTLTDWVADFDYIFKKNAFGNYFCELCEIANQVEGGREFYSIYKTRRDFLRTESYEPFLEWCNEKIVPSHHIIFYESYTKLGELEDVLSKSKKEPFYIFKIKEKKR